MSATSIILATRSKQLQRPRNLKQGCMLEKERVVQQKGAGLDGRGYCVAGEVERQTSSQLGPASHSSASSEPGATFLETKDVRD